MIYKILTEDEVKELSSELQRRLPGTAKIFYVIGSYLNGLLPGKEVIVDAWPEWNSIIIRTCTENETQPFFRHAYMCHAKCASSLKYFLQRPDVVDWKKPASFTGVPHDVAPVIQSMCHKHTGRLTAMEPRFMYAWTKTDLPPEPSVPDGLHLSTLTVDDAATLRHDWEGSRYREDLEGYFRTVIEHFDSSCLRDVNGELMAYTCMQFNGSMAMLYVKPEHRDKDYFRIVLCDLARRRLGKGDVAYGYIPTNDSILVDQMRALDFVWVPRGDSVWLNYEPLRVNGSKSKSFSMPMTISSNVRGASYTNNDADADMQSRSLDCVVSHMAQLDRCRKDVSKQENLKNSDSAVIGSVPVLSNIVGSS